MHECTREFLAEPSSSWFLVYSSGFTSLNSSNRGEFPGES